GSGNALAVWDLDTGKRVTTLTLATSPWRWGRGFVSCAIDPAGKWLAVARLDKGQGLKLELLDLSTGKVVRSRNVWNLYTIAFTRDGARLVCGTASSVEVYETASLGRLLFQSGDFLSGAVLGVSPDGNHVAYPSFQQESVRVWNIATNRLAFEFQSPSAA